MGAPKLQCEAWQTGTQLVNKEMPALKLRTNHIGPRLLRCVFTGVAWIGLSWAAGLASGQSGFGGAPGFQTPGFPTPGFQGSPTAPLYPAPVPTQPYSQPIPYSQPSMAPPSIGIPSIHDPGALNPPVVVGPPPSVGYLPAPSITASSIPDSKPIASDAPSRRRASDPGLETLVTISSHLQDLLENGGEPDDLRQLQLLEKQVQKVAQQAVKCTVSVQIGPAQGCGVIITESGYILTAAHVAMRPQKLARVTLSDGRRVTARTLGMNRRVDAGLMKIEPNQNNGKPWAHASLGNSSKIQAGMWCVATGHPGGYDPARGSVARVGRILTSRSGAIETDCALIGGDSGGPLFDIAGRLIAVHSRIGNDVTENLHVPIDYYGKSWDRMRSGEAYGYLPGFRPTLGVKGKVKSHQATVTIVKKGSPAQEAGIKVGDTIVQFGDVTISDFKSLQGAVSQTMPGERVPVLLTRKTGSTHRVIVEIGRAD